MKLKFKNFLAINEASLKSENNLVVILAPNRCGKTHILRFLYSLYWSFWKSKRDNEDFKKVFFGKVKKVFLIKELKEIISWDKREVYIEFVNNIGEYYLRSVGNGLVLDMKVNKDMQIEKSPIYLYVPGLGDFYKGILSLKKYYPNWNIVSEAITDFITDLVILSDLKDYERKKSHKELLNIMEDFFQAKFYIQNGKINISEQNRSYSLEKTASGLKTIAWIYLILKYDLLGDLLLIDEPENSLHPEFNKKLAKILYYLSKLTKIIIATHSDYLLESLNLLIKKEDLKVDVWYGDYTEDGIVYKCYEANKENLIDSSPLTKTFLNIVQETYGRKSKS